MRRTSLKIALVSIPFFLFGWFAMWSAEAYDRKINLLHFTTLSRAWNYWDYLALCSFALFIALVVVSLMFLDKCD